MLLHFSVKNFKQFKSLALDFQRVRDYAINKECLTKDGKALKTVLVYGPNASGKSNLGLALFDIAWHLFDMPALPRACRYYLNADNPERPAEFSYTFKLGGDIVRYEYAKTACTKLAAEALYVNDALVFAWDAARGLSEFPNPGKWRLAAAIAGGVQASFLRHAVEGGVKKNSPMARLVKFAGRMLWVRPCDGGAPCAGFSLQADSVEQFVVDHSLVNELEGFLRRYGVADALEVRKVQDGSLRICSRHAGELPFFDTASSGVCAMAALFCCRQAFADASFIFVDDFDAFLHRKAAQDIFLLLRGLKTQAVLTTHNTSLLDHRLTRADCCFEMSGGLMSFADRTQREIRTGNNLEKLYRAGEFDDEKHCFPAAASPLL